MLDYFTRIATLGVPPILLLFINESHAMAGDFDTFVGPGVMECDAGQCEFSVDPGLGCSDPCHTKTHQHMFDLAFKHVADTSNIVAPGGRVCCAKQAKNINSYFPDEYVTIEKGCTAKCTGCSFAPTVAIAGPAKMDCRVGRCLAYTHKNNFDCGTALAAASKDWGSFHTLVGGDDETHSFHGYEHINTNGPIRIPNGCNLECSRCRRVADGLRNFRAFRGGDDPN